MAASFLKRKPKEPDGPQRQEIPVLEADAETGLSAAQAQERLDGGWGNAPVESPGASVREIIAKNVFTYFNFLFFLLAGCVIAVRQWLNLTFLGPVFCNMFIGIVQDLRVKKKVDGLKIMAAPKCRAVRDGQTVELDAAQLVRDDIAVFSPGDQIPAGAVVAAGECRVNEALVTGEADEIVKKPGERLLSGSFVVSGSCRARLTAVGADSFVSRLTLEAKQTGSQPQSEMMHSLTSLIKWIGFLVIPLGAVMFIKEYLWLKSPIVDAVTSTVGSIVGENGSGHEPVQPSCHILRPRRSAAGVRSHAAADRRGRRLRPEILGRPPPARPQCPGKSPAAARVQEVHVQQAGLL